MPTPSQHPDPRACKNCGAVASSIATGLELPTEEECQIGHTTCIHCGHDATQRNLTVLRPGAMHATLVPSLRNGRRVHQPTGYVAALAS